jgi:hypothetical protein
MIYKGNTMIKIEATCRGFMLGEFEDANGEKCSIQKSSACCREEAEGEYIWLGNNNANPMVLASDAHALGISTTETTGWIPYPVPKQVSMKTRMHLSQRQVKELLPLLNYFAKTGQLPTNMSLKKKS